MACRIIILALLWISPLFLAFSGKAIAYVMPAEQILNLMAGNFSSLTDLVITQSSHLKNPQTDETESTLNERIWLKAPDLYYSENVTALEENTGDRGSARPQERDMWFWPLLMASSITQMKTYLSDLGIDISTVQLTRFDGTVVYRLGEKRPARPHLVIDKETFRPVFLRYNRYIGGEIRSVNVRFNEYQPVQKGWYPSAIEYSISEDGKERCIITHIEANTGADKPFSKIRVEAPPVVDQVDQPADSLKDKRLEEIIELLKKKY